MKNRKHVNTSKADLILNVSSDPTERILENETLWCSLHVVVRCSLQRDGAAVCFTAVNLGCILRRCKCRLLSLPFLNFISVKRDLASVSQRAL